MTDSTQSESRKPYPVSLDSGKSPTILEKNMAEAQANLSLGGYDDEFVSAMDEDLQCPICHLPLKDTVQTEECGHRFCRKCLEGHFTRLERDRRPLSCPVDRNNLTREKDMFPDKATNRKILSFIIKCPSEGCQWTGALRSKEDHLKVCPLKVVFCSNQNCRVTLTRNKLQMHVTTTCDWRILRCKHCSFPSPACKTKAHKSECKRFPLNCSKSCGAMIAREEISDHIANDCPLAIVFCPYAEMGCTAKVRRNEVECHLQSAMRAHLDLACVKLNNTQIQLNSAQEAIRKLEETTRTLEEKLQTTTKKFEEKLEETTVEVEECIETTNELERKLGEQTGVHTWKISDFGEVLGEAISGNKTEIESDIFYDCNYKFSLSLYPNGIDTKSINHLSIYFQILKGEYDAMLSWPFSKEVTFTLIDQQENPEDRENIVDSFRAEPEHEECFRRPVEEVNTGYGVHKFVSLNTLKKRRYIVDDTIFIQVNIAPPQ